MEENAGVTKSLLSLAKRFLEGADEENDDTHPKKEIVGQIEEWIRKLVSQMEWVTPFFQVPNTLAENTRSMINRAEDLIQTYKKVSRQSKHAGINKKFLYWRQKKNLSNKLNMIEEEIRNVVQAWIFLDVQGEFSDGDDGDNSEIKQYLAKEIKEKLLIMDHTPLVVPVIGIGWEDRRAICDLTDDDHELRSRFPCRAWVLLPLLRDEECTLDNISKHFKIGLKANTELASSSSGCSVDEYSLQDMLMANSCLIVLDEVRTPRAWDIIYQILQSISALSTRSKVILFTNKKFVTSSLFNSTDNIFHSPIILRQIGEKVPSHLSMCLYYFLLFPITIPVSARRLIALWIAEGVVHVKKNENGLLSAEHVAEKYLDELINLDLVRATKRKFNGKVKDCILNDDDGSQRDMWLKMAKEARFFEDAKGYITRLVDNHGTNDPSPSFIQVQSNIPSSTKDYKNVSSFMSFDTKEGMQSGEDIGDFLNKCILAGCFLWMRVLDLERVFRPKLPKAISRLTHLKYLGLRWTYLENLPKYVCTLLNLEVLDLKHTYIKFLPKSIWRMEYLRHLYLSECCYIRFDKSPSHIYLRDLQTLWDVFIDEECLDVQPIRYLRSIRKLGLSCRSTQLPYVCRWISTLEFLETLRLKSLDEHGRASDLPLESLAASSNLSTLYLVGKLPPLVVSTFPRNITEVTLSGSDLKEDPMEHLGKLRKLVVLRLLSHSVTGSKMCCPGGSFPKLKIVKIWELPNLENWEAEGGALPCLEYMEIRGCNNLKLIPQALQHIDTLQEFELTRMPQRFIDDSKAMQPELWSKIEGVLKVNSGLE